MKLTNKSRILNRMIELDRFHSGIEDKYPTFDGLVKLADRMTILSTSQFEQYTNEAKGSVAFAGLFVGVLESAAANLIGLMTPNGANAHVERSIGP